MAEVRAGFNPCPDAFTCPLSPSDSGWTGPPSRRSWLAAVRQPFKSPGWARLDSPSREAAVCKPPQLRIRWGEGDDLQLFRACGVLFHGGQADSRSVVQVRSTRLEHSNPPLPSPSFRTIRFHVFALPRPLTYAFQRHNCSDGLRGAGARLLPYRLRRLSDADFERARAVRRSACAATRARPTALVAMKNDLSGRTMNLPS
jgi:hypothetical protein